MNDQSPAFAACAIVFKCMLQSLNNLWMKGLRDIGKSPDSLLPVEHEQFRSLSYALLALISRSRDHEVAHVDAMMLFNGNPFFMVPFRTLDRLGLPNESWTVAALDHINQVRKWYLYWCEHPPDSQAYEDSMLALCRKLKQSERDAGQSVTPFTTPAEQRFMSQLASPEGARLLEQENASAAALVAPVLSSLQALIGLSASGAPAAEIESQQNVILRQGMQAAQPVLNNVKTMLDNAEPAATPEDERRQQSLRALFNVVGDLLGSL